MGQISQTEFKHFSDKTYFIISKYLLLRLILFKEILVLISNIYLFKFLFINASKSSLNIKKPE